MTIITKVRESETKHETNKVGVTVSNLNSLTGKSSRKMQILWDAITQYSTDCIAVTDIHGNFIWSNSAAQKFLCQGNRTLIGRSWLDVLPTKLANERIARTCRAADENQDSALIGMIHGICTCSVFRACNSVGINRREVFAIINAMHSTALVKHIPVTKGCEILYAKHNDLGQLSILSERELEVLALIGHGQTIQQIADSLQKSKKTIEWHRRSIGKKLGATDRVELAKIAVHSGIHHMGVIRPQWISNLKPFQKNNPVLEKRK